MKTQTRQAHLSIEERRVIMSERLRGSSCRWIAAQLGRSPSTISRELRRGVAAESSTYQARFAQQAIGFDVRPRAESANWKPRRLVELRAGFVGFVPVAPADRR
jgi:IS30 family transposase